MTLLGNFVWTSEQCQKGGRRQGKVGALIYYALVSAHGHQGRNKLRPLQAAKIVRTPQIIGPMPGDTSADADWCMLVIKLNPFI